MLRRLLPLAAALIAVTAAPALAKGPDRASVCGAGACRTIHGERAVSALFVWLDGRPFSPRPAPGPAPFYEVRMADRGVRWVLLYVPARRALRIWQNRMPPSKDAVAPYWRTLGPADEAVFRRAAGRLAPHAAPRVWPR